jgi:hypothetical protein
MPAKALCPDWYRAVASLRSPLVQRAGSTLPPEIRLTQIDIMLLFQKQTLDKNKYSRPES